MTLLRRALLASIVVSSSVAPALAGSDSSELTVTATVQNSCEITGGALAFGVYDSATGAAVEGSATMGVACTTGAVTTIMLDQGANPDAGSSDEVPLRRLSDGGDSFLSYTLYSDAARSTVWGNTERTGKEYTAESSAPTVQTVYGRLAGRQVVPDGAYTDHIVATIMF